MKAEELLKPRYKVIADYPDSNCEIGHIINGHKAELWSDFYDKYPCIFKKLEWWEEIEEKDMPKKITREGLVLSVENWIQSLLGWRVTVISANKLDSIFVGSNGWLPVD